MVTDDIVRIGLRWRRCSSLMNKLDQDKEKFALAKNEFCLERDRSIAFLHFIARVNWQWLKLLFSSYKWFAAISEQENESSYLNTVYGSFQPVIIVETTFQYSWRIYIRAFSTTMLMLREQRCSRNESLLNLSPTLNAPSQVRLWGRNVTKSFNKKSRKRNRMA